LLHANNKFPRYCARVPSIARKHSSRRILHYISTFISPDGSNNQTDSLARLSREIFMFLPRKVYSFTSCPRVVISARPARVIRLVDWYWHQSTGVHTVDRCSFLALVQSLLATDEANDGRRPVSITQTRVRLLTPIYYASCRWVHGLHVQNSRWK